MSCATFCIVASSYIFASYPNWSALASNGSTARNSAKAKSPKRRIRVIMEIDLQEQEGVFEGLEWPSRPSLASLREDEEILIAYSSWSQDFGRLGKAIRILIRHSCREIQGRLNSANSATYISPRSPGNPVENSTVSPLKSISQDGDRR